MPEHAVKNEQSDLSLLPLPELEAELCAVAQDRHSSKHRLLHLLAEYDARNGWVLHGATSCTAWWADVCGIERSTAREQLRVARALIALPALDRAVETGRLSYAKAKVISRLAESDTIDELVELSEPCPAGRLGILLAAWQQRHESGESMSAAQHQARTLSWRVEPDGMTTYAVRVPPIESGQIQTAVDTQVMRTTAPAGASLAQSRVDALIELLSSGSSVSAEVLIHVAHTENGELTAALADGTPVPDADVSRILCESSIRALVHDSAGHPIDASPGRPAPTKRQMRLLHERDQHCRYPGCTARIFLHAHHIVHREHGGPTIISNLILLCSFHHRLVHEVGWPDGHAPAVASGS